MTCLTRFFRAVEDVANFVAKRIAVRIDLRNAGLAEIFAHHDVGGKLAPLRGISASVISKTTEPSGLEIRLVRRVPFDGGKDIMSRLGEASCDFHRNIPLNNMSALE